MYPANSLLVMILLRRRVLARSVGITVTLALGLVVSAAPEDDRVVQIEPRFAKFLAQQKTDYFTFARVAVSHDGSLVATRVLTGKKPQQIVVWNADNARSLLQISFQQATCSMAFSPDGQFIALGGPKDSGVHLWRISDGGKAFTLPAHSSPWEKLFPVVFAFSSDGRMIAVEIEPQKKLVVHDVGQRKRVLELSTVRSLTLDGQQHKSIELICFAADAKTLVAVNGNGALFGWNLTTGKPSFQMTKTAISVGPAAHSPGAFSLDRELRLIALVYSHFVRIHRVPSGQLVRQIDRPNNSVISQVAISPNGRLIALQMDKSRREVDLVNIESGAVAARLLAPAPREEREMEKAALVVPAEAVWDLSFSCDGSRLCATTRYSAYLWDVGMIRE